MVTACCAAVVTWGQVSLGDTGSTQLPAPHPVSHCCSLVQGAQTCLLTPAPAAGTAGLLLVPVPVPVPSPSPCSPAAAPAPRRSGRCRCKRWPGCGGSGGRRARRCHCNMLQRSRGSHCCGRTRVSGSLYPSWAQLPPPTAQHPPSHRAGASLQLGLAPTQGQGHPPRGRGIPHRSSGIHPSPGHPGGARLTRSCSSCSQHRSRMSHLCGSSRLGRES